MPSTRDIRRRIKSVKNTAQITKAMQMVAAAKMRKAQQAALAGRPYAALMNEVLAEAAARTVDFKHPLMEVAPGAEARGHPGQHRPRLVRRAQQQFVPRSGEVRPRTRPFHHRRAQGGAIHRAHETAAGGGIHLQGHAAVRRGAGHFQIRAGHVSQGRSGRGGHFVHQFHFHAVQQPKIVPFLPIGKIKAVTAGHVHAPAQELPAGGARDVFDSSRTRRPCWAHCCRTA